MSLRSFTPQKSFSVVGRSSLFGKRTLSSSSARSEIFVDQLVTMDNLLRRSVIFRGGPKVDVAATELFFLKATELYKEVAPTALLKGSPEFGLARPSRLALSRRGAYRVGGVKQPFVNLDEKIDRFVGRRSKMPDSLEAGMQLQAAAVEFHRAFKHRWAAKGVYRFKTHEEADQWMMKMLARADRSKI